MSRWHRVASDEVWHYYEGAALELFTADPEFADFQMLRELPAEVAARTARHPEIELFL